VTIYNIYIKF